ncbi:MAG: methylated-DNA--[protein]-cysteine S-methyltransferase [Haloarculaceae archaeon]
MHVDVFGFDVELDTSLVDDADPEVRRQVEEYVAGERTTFDLSVAFPATFTGEVLRLLVEIPAGETRGYAELADELDSVPRAVGGGCARNPLPVVVPCHRVVGVDSLVGYRYPGLKSRLLDHEGATYPGEPLA